MTNRSALIVAVFLAVTHIVLAGIYASITPYRTSGILLGQRDPVTGMPAKSVDIGCPDERQHANYVLKLLNGEGIPHLDPKDPKLEENYQSHQPPLYYFLEAGWVKITGADLTSPAEGLKVRFLNTLIGASTVIGVFFLGLWAFRRADVGILGAAFVALLPMNCALSGAVGNDPLLFSLCTWTLALCAKGIVDGFSVKLALIVGTLAGLALLTKTTGISLFIVLALSLWLAKSENKLKPATVFTTFGSWAIFVFPWLFRNFSIYGDPLALKAFNQAFVNSPQASDYIQGMGPYVYWVDMVGWWTARSFFGVFGYMDIFMNERGSPFTGPGAPNSLYRVLIALTVLAFISWLLAIRKPEWKEYKRIHILSVVFVVVITALFLRFNAQYFQGQARYLLPAIAPIGIGFAIGILGVAKDKWKVATGVFVAILVALNAYAISRLPAEFSRRTPTFSERIQTDFPSPFVIIGNGRDGRSV